MNVGDVMARDVEFIAPEASAQAAAELMGELDVGALPVGSPERLIGIVTDRDLLYRVVAAGRDPARTSVGEVCSRPALTCRAEDSLHVAMDAMAANHVRRLAVEAADTHRVVGWITLADVARQLLVEDDALQSRLRVITDPGADPG